MYRICQHLDMYQGIYRSCCMVCIATRESLLIFECQDSCLARPVGGRVVIVSAELHTLATDASPDYKYGDSQDAYNRRCAVLQNVVQ